jgi:hypothetical protein
VVLTVSKFAFVARLGKLSLAGLSALMLAGCSGQAPKVMLATPNGPVTLNAPASSAPQGGLATPPPGLEQPAPMPAPSVSRSGTYTGTATLLASNGYMCRNSVKVSGFHVNGNAVQFGGFRGTIQSDGGLQMVNRNQWIVGQFEGATFSGQISFSSNRLGPGCAYVLNLQRTSA